MLALLLLGAHSAILGIDIGSEFLRAAILRPGKPIEVLLTSDSKRVFPIPITVVPKKAPVPDSITEADVNDLDFMTNDPLSMKKYPNSTIHHWSNFIAKQYNESLIELALRRKLYATPSKTEDGRLLLAGLLPEVVFYRALETVNASMKHHDPNSVVTSTVITVPKFWPQPERDALRAIARVRQFKPYIVDSTRAYSTLFALEHQQHFKDGPLNVAFCDVGAASIEVAVNEFKKKPRVVVKELAYEFDDTVGGRDFDIVLYNLITENFTGTISSRGEQQILLEAAKAKHRLTTDSEVAGVIEQVDGQNDLKYHITRDQFEAAVEPLLESIRKTIRRVLETEVKVDRVHILGGGSRVPCVKRAVMDAFGVEKLMFSMNAEESNAVCAAYVGAAQSSDYMLSKVIYQPLETYVPAIEDDNGTVYEFAKKSPVPGEHQCIVANATGSWPLGSSTKLLCGSPTENSTIGKTKEGLYRFRNLTEKVSKPWKQRAFEVAWAIYTRERAESLLEFTVNSLERLLLDTKQTLEEETRLEEMATENERQALATAVRVTDQWFLNQQRFEQDAVSKKLQLLEDAVGSVMCRVQNSELLPEAEKNMTRLVQEIHTTMTENWMERKKKPKRQMIRELLRMIADLELWYKEKKERQAKLGPRDNPILLWSDLRDRVNDLSKKFETSKDILMGRYPRDSNKNRNVFVSGSASVSFKD